MKIKTLIKKLQKLDQNLEIILSSDAEGNSFNLLSEINDEVSFMDEDELFIIDEEEIEGAVYEYGKKAIKKGIIFWSR